MPMASEQTTETSPDAAKPAEAAQAAEAAKPAEAEKPAEAKKPAAAAAPGKPRAEDIKMDAQARARGTKSALRQLRAAGQVPAIVYGEAKDPTEISVSQLALNRLYRTGRMLSTPLELALDGKTQRVILRDLQLDAVRDTPIHADFLRLGAGTKLVVNVPVRFLNAEQSPGIKRGGVLNVVRHEIELLCQADAIPEFIALDLEGSDIGHSFHISTVALPANVRPTIARDFTIATIAAPTKMDEPEPKPEDEEAEEGAEEAEGDAADKEAADGKADAKADGKADDKTEGKADGKTEGKADAADGKSGKSKD